MKAEWLRTKDDKGELATGEWRRHWKHRTWGLETTLET